MRSDKVWCFSEEQHPTTLDFAAVAIPLLRVCVVHCIACHCQAGALCSRVDCAALTLAVIKSL